MAVPQNPMRTKHKIWHKYTPLSYQAHKSHCENACNNHFDQVVLIKISWTDYNYPRDSILTL